MENDLPEMTGDEAPAIKTRRPGRPPSDTAEKAKPVRSVERAFEIIEFLTQQDTPLAFADIATTLEIPSATAHRILSTMEAADYLYLDDHGMYSLGGQFIRLAHRVLRIRTMFRDTARGFLHDLVETTGETANLAILDGTEAAYLDQVQTNKMLRAQTFLRVPLHCSGTGKALLAYQDDSTVDEILTRLMLDERTEHTFTDKDDLRAELKTIATKGMAIDDEEMEIGVRCIAAPILVDGTAIASISIAGPTTRITRERIEEFGSEVRRVAAELSNTVRERFPDLAAGSLL
jgi:DNA-binding IclR family transcriptional regulator